MRPLTLGGQPRADRWLAGALGAFAVLTAAEGGYLVRQANDHLVIPAFFGPYDPQHVLRFHSIGFGQLAWLATLVWLLLSVGVLVRLAGRPARRGSLVLGGLLCAAGVSLAVWTARGGPYHPSPWSGPLGIPHSMRVGAVVGFADAAVAVGLVLLVTGPWLRSVARRRRPAARGPSPLPDGS